MRTLLTFSKLNRMRLLSHLDVTRLFRRAIKRAGIDIEYTGGFNPQQKITVTNPLPLGYESTAEMMMIETHSAFTNEHLQRLNTQLPRDIQVLSFREMADGEDIHTDFRFSTFEIRGLMDCTFVLDQIRMMKAQPSAVYVKEVVKKKKRRIREKNLLPLTGDASCSDGILMVTLGSFDTDTVRPQELLAYLNEQNNQVRTEGLAFRRVGQQKHLERDGKPA